MESENPDLFFPELSPIENDLLCQNYSVDDSEPILLITIDIGNGRKDQIKAYEYDDSDQLALDFCHKHKLGSRAKILLSDEIEKYLKIAISRARAINTSSHAKSSASSRKESMNQSPNRPRRSQNFTQKSMQVKRNLLRDSGQAHMKQNNSSVLAKVPNVQDSPDNSKLKPQKAVNKNFKVQNTNIIYQGSESKKKSKEFGERSPIRCNSLYSKEKSIKDRSIDLHEEPSRTFSPSKSVLIPDCSSRYDYSEGSIPAYLSQNTLDHNNFKSTSQLKTLGTEKTEQLMKKIKYQRYKEVFNMMMPDTKGVITRETINKSALPSTIRKILSPLIEELGELNETLDFNEFYDAMEMLMKVLTPGDKSAFLLPSKAKVVEKQEFNFKPKTNVGQNSVSSLGLYERSLQKKQDFSRKIQKEREIKHETEMKECKFTPSIIANHRKTKSSNTTNGLSKSYDP